MKPTPIIDVWITRFTCHSPIPSNVRLLLCGFALIYHEYLSSCHFAFENSIRIWMFTDLPKLIWINLLCQKLSNTTLFQLITLENYLSRNKKVSNLQNIMSKYQEISRLEDIISKILNPIYFVNSIVWWYLCFKPYLFPLHLVLQHFYEKWNKLCF